jgi:methylmalonyl-CoA/ethylmalonyl-CoA epimerase
MGQRLPETSKLFRTEISFCIRRRIFSNMAANRMITQICIVVRDVRKVNANWAKVLGAPEEKIEIIFPDGILHHTYGKVAEYKDCQVAKYQLDNFVLELIQPGQTPSPWRTFLEKHGQGVFHFCILVDDRKVFQQTLSDIDVDLPYHIGYHPNGSYSYVDSSEQLGLELSVNNQADYTGLIQQLLNGTALPLDELH